MPCLALPPRALRKGATDFDLQLYAMSIGWPGRRVGRFGKDGKMNWRFCRQCRERKENLSCVPRFCLRSLLPDGRPFLAQGGSAKTSEELIAGIVAGNGGPN